MSNTIITACPTALDSPSLAPEFFTLRDRLLAEAKPIATVKSEDDQRGAIAIVSRLKAVTKDIEASRKAVKQPYIDMGKRIDIIAAEATQNLATESARIEGAIGQYQTEERHKQREAEEAAEKERRRIAMEAQKAEQEAARLRAEAEKAKGKKAIDLLDKAEDAEIKAAELQNEVMAPVPIAEPTKAHGSTIREEFNIEVLDLALLFRSHPQCVEMKPRLMAIKDLIRAGQREIPGVKLTPVVNVAVRAASMPSLR